MKYHKEIFRIWKEKTMASLNLPEAALLVPDRLNLDQYRSYLLETFFHTRENPFSQVLCASHFPRNQHDLFKKFVMHALGEVKHDLMALNDYRIVGGNPELVYQRPLQATADLIDFTFSIARDSSPLRYLAYLYHVEHLPTENGHSYLAQLRKAGVPENGLTFLEEHCHVDVVHNKMMDGYISALVNTDSKFQTFVEAFDPAMQHHFGMIVAAFQRPLEASVVNSIV